MRCQSTENGQESVVDAEPGTPLPWALHELRQHGGPKFDCGMAQCGSCMVPQDDERTCSGRLPVGALPGRWITTVQRRQGGMGAAVGSARLEERVPQCGYGSSGRGVDAAGLLSRDGKPSCEPLATDLCRCGTYMPRARAIERGVRDGEMRNARPTIEGGMIVGNTCAVLPGRRMRHLPLIPEWAKAVLSKDKAAP